MLFKDAKSISLSHNFPINEKKNVSAFLLFVFCLYKELDTWKLNKCFLSI